ncbi:hypothetical protein EON67_05345 [archaeon]|nr:MAG: hypothetical protein EON67_05345 [archaeon]
MRRTFSSVATPRRSMYLACSLERMRSSAGVPLLRKRPLCAAAAGARPVALASSFAAAAARSAAASLAALRMDLSDCTR